MPFQSNRLSAYTTYLLLSAVGAFATNTIFTINMVYQIEVIRLNPLQLVLVGTMLEGVTFLCQVPTGVLADVYSRRLSVIVGYILMGAGFLLEGLWPTFVSVLLAQVIWGAGYTFVNGAEEAWVADEVGGDVGRVFIRGTQIGQIASLASIPLSIWLAVFRLNLPVIVGGGLLVLLGLFLFLFMPERRFRPIQSAERNSWQALGRVMVSGFRAVRHSRMLLFILAITAFNAMASEGFDRLQTDHFIQDFSFPTLGHLSTVVWFGVISAGSMILTLVVTELVRRYVDTRSHRALVATMFAFNVLLIVSVAAFSLAGNFYLALGAFWCASVFRRADSPLYNTWIASNSDPGMRATVISMFGQVDAIGQIAGGPAVGFIGTLISLRAALLTTCAILAPNVAFFAGALRLSKHMPLSPTDGESEEEAQPVTAP